MILFITGASGVGKTTTIEFMEKNYPTQFLYFHFDDIGIPSSEEMALIKNWQEKTTHEWIEKLTLIDTTLPIVIEGSTNMSHIKSGFEKFNYVDYKIALIHCEEEDMIQRLIDRGQPELVCPDTKGWRNYLNRQAKQFNAPIFNTSELNLSKTATKIMNFVFA